MNEVQVAALRCAMDWVRQATQFVEHHGQKHVVVRLLSARGVQNDLIALRSEFDTTLLMVNTAFQLVVDGGAALAAAMAAAGRAAPVPAPAPARPYVDPLDELDDEATDQKADLTALVDEEDLIVAGAADPDPEASAALRRTGKAPVEVVRDLKASVKAAMQATKRRTLDFLTEDALTGWCRASARGRVVAHECCSSFERGGGGGGGGEEEEAVVVFAVAVARRRKRVPPCSCAVLAEAQRPRSAARRRRRCEPQRARQRRLWPRVPSGTTERRVPAGAHARARGCCACLARAGRHGELRAWRPGWQVAVKVFLADISEKNVARARREMTILAQFEHRNIVRVLGANFEPPKMYIVTEYVSRGSLRALLDRRAEDELAEELRPLLARLRLALDLVEALLYMHARGFLHGDVKAGNLLVDEQWRCKLCDFGLTAARDEVRATTRRPMSIKASARVGECSSACVRACVRVLLCVRSYTCVCVRCVCVCLC